MPATHRWQSGRERLPSAPTVTIWEQLNFRSTDGDNDDPIFCFRTTEHLSNCRLDLVLALVAISKDALDTGSRSNPAPSR